MENKCCPICNHRQRDANFPQLCISCGWEFEQFLFEDEHNKINIKHEVSIRKNYWNKKDRLQKQIEEEKSKIEVLEKERDSYANEIQEIESQARKLERKLQEFRENNFKEIISFTELKSTLIRLKSTLGLEANELEDEVNFIGLNKVQIECSFSNNFICVEMNQIPLEDIRLVVGFSQKNSILLIQKANFIFNINFDKSDFRPSYRNTYTAEWKIPSIKKGEYYIRFAKYMMNEIDNIQVISKDSKINYQ